jgi:ActR/RegA family two-component response regulator
MGCFMDCLALKGRSILVVEEDTLLALRLEDELLRAGARALGARRLNEALHLAEHPALAAAVVNLRLGSDSTLQVCRRLAELGIPFVFHTRYDAAEALRTWPDAPVVSKPAESHVVVSSVVRLLH